MSENALPARFRHLMEANRQLEHDGVLQIFEWAQTNIPKDLRGGVHGRTYFLDLVHDQLAIPHEIIDHATEKHNRLEAVDVFLHDANRWLAEASREARLAEVCDVIMSVTESGVSDIDWESAYDRMLTESFEAPVGLGARIMRNTRWNNGERWNMRVAAGTAAAIVKHENEMEPQQ